MKYRLSALGTAFVLLAGAAQTSAARQDPPPLPTIDVSTVLFLMLTWDSQTANTADPIDINQFNVDFGDDDESLGDIDDVLQGK